LASIVFRLLAPALTLLSAAVFVLYYLGPAQCMVPMYTSLSLYGPPMWVRPGLCAVDPVVPVWFVAVLGTLFGGWYLVRACRPRSAPPQGPTRP
jgi:hypothetical protein